MKTELKINGMHCGSCALDIKETLEETQGVQAADVTFARGTALIEFDEQVITPAQLAHVIEELGYQTQAAG